MNRRESAEIASLTPVRKTVRGARRRTTLLALAALLLGPSVFTSALGCGTSEGSYEANVEIQRMRVVRRDAEGVPMTMDIEFSFVECPGTQIEVLRGGKDFAACIASHKKGDLLKIKIRHFWSSSGQMDYEISQVGECVRPPDPNDEASFRMIRECEDWKVHGAVVGFLCRVAPERALVSKCPWFAKG